MATILAIAKCGRSSFGRQSHFIWSHGPDGFERQCASTAMLRALLTIGLAQLRAGFVEQVGLENIEYWPVLPSDDDTLALHGQREMGKST